MKRFRPLAGINCNGGLLIASLCTKTFSPPYGDSNLFDKDSKKLELFSPPYGDGTLSNVRNGHSITFSPPYGDGTLNISQNTAKLKSRMAGKYSLY